MPLPMYSQRAEPLSQIKNIIAIAAGKGGVGKSTVTVNLAEALSQEGYRVGIMDIDIYGPSICKMLPEDKGPIKTGESFAPALCRGIQLMSLAYFRKEGQASAVRAPIANGIVMQFVEKVVWDPLDFLLIDFPPGTGDVQLTICQKVNLTAAVMVTTPQELAVMDVRKAIDLFDQVKVPIVGIVENMSYYLPQGSNEKIYFFGQAGGVRLACDVGVPVLGKIPLEPKICECADQGESLLSQSIAAAQSFREVAKELVEHLSVVNADTGDCLGDCEPVQIHRLWQKSHHSFAIEWSDGVCHEYRLHEVQKRCPCAQCFNGASKKRLVRESDLDKEVRAESIMNVGKYGVRFVFSSGCSHGIYDFELLRSLAGGV